MESIISNLVARFEKGSLSRRELVQGLAMLAASGTAATAQEDINFKAANIDHVSVQVADIQRSTDFYRKMFGFTVVSQAEEGGVKIVRLGNTKTLVSLNHGGPPGTVWRVHGVAAVTTALATAVTRDAHTASPMLTARACVTLPGILIPNANISPTSTSAPFHPMA